MEGVYPHQTSSNIMSKIALVKIQLPLFLPKIYDLASYVAAYIAHLQQMFDFSFQLHHFTLMCMEWLFVSHYHSPCRMYRNF